MRPLESRARTGEGRRGGVEVDSGLEAAAASGGHGPRESRRSGPARIRHLATSVSPVPAREEGDRGRAGPPSGDGRRRLRGPGPGEPVGPIGPVVLRQAAVEEELAALGELREERLRAEADEDVPVREPLQAALALGRGTARPRELADEGRLVVASVELQDQPAGERVELRRARPVVEHADPAFPQHAGVVLEVELGARPEPEVAAPASERPEDPAARPVDLVDR